MKVTRLSVTPIKGLALHHPQRIEVTDSGAVGDREFFLVDEADRLFSVAKTGTLFTLEASFDETAFILSIAEAGRTLVQAPVFLREPISADFFSFRTVEGRLAPGPWDDLFSERAGRSLRLVKADGRNGGVDVEPLTILGDASTGQLARVAGVDEVDARRFRMLIDFDGAQPHAEDEWEGRQLAIGEAVIEVGGPVQRCAGTTRNPVTGAVDLRTLALIGEYRGRQDSVFGMGFNFGRYARTVRPGAVAVGDEIHLLA